MSSITLSAVYLHNGPYLATIRARGCSIIDFVSFHRQKLRARKTARRRNARHSASESRDVYERWTVIRASIFSTGYECNLFALGSWPIDKRFEHSPERYYVLLVDDHTTQIYTYTHDTIF